ncbi:LuxR C-terminal-related transcriptional regulator [Rhodobacter sp. JA431]|uniref:response regulator transcription factor n=1 Tax=Rhodobacter sp. JA431 TaxID=570013 RepID=UPI0014837F96|nr:LuxR C-terminal-related transcriptional regulator [Rhodobacter sp. JA431]
MTKIEAESRVLIAHREQLAVDALSAELGNQAVRVCAMNNVTELNAQVTKSLSFEAAIIDYRIFPAAGIDQVRKLVKKLGDVPVIMFASSLEHRLIPVLLQAGVRGIIPESMPLKAIPSVLYLVKLGQVFTGGLQLDPVQADAPSPHNLTNEEYAILKRAANGDTNKEIASEFDITEVRVKMLMRSICRKISARNRAHACVIAREHGLL